MTKATNRMSTGGYALAALLAVVVAAAAGCGQGTGHPGVDAEAETPDGELLSAVLRVEGMT